MTSPVKPAEKEKKSPEKKVEKVEVAPEKSVDEETPAAEIFNIFGWLRVFRFSSLLSQQGC